MQEERIGGLMKGTQRIMHVPESKGWRESWQV